MTTTSSSRYSNQRAMSPPAAPAQAPVDDQLEGIGHARGRGGGDEQRDARRRRGARDIGARSPRPCRGWKRAALGLRSAGAWMAMGGRLAVWPARLNCRNAARCSCSICLRAEHIGPTTVSRANLATGDSMLYDAYEVQRSLMAGASRLAGLGAGWLNNPSNPFGYSSMGPVVAAGPGRVRPCLMRRAASPNSGSTDGRGRREEVAVDEEIVLRKPFGQLKHFRKAGRRRPAAAADRRADVGPLCDPAARHGRADAAEAGRVHHRLARRQAGAAGGRAASTSTIMSII